MNLKNKHIIVIDDTSSIRTFLRISFEGQGARFSEAATASEGVSICHREQPDLIVLDLGLPDRDGLELIPELSELPASPVIVLTVRNDLAMKTKALASGAKAYLTKPFEMEELLDVIDRHLPMTATA